MTIFFTDKGQYQIKGINFLAGIGGEVFHAYLEYFDLSDGHIERRLLGDIDNIECLQGSLPKDGLFDIKEAKVVND